MFDAIFPAGGKKRRKAQFMIIGAVIVGVMLYKVAAILNENQHFDPSSIQKDTSKIIFENIESGLLETAGNNRNYAYDIIELTEFYKTLYLKEGYHIDIDINETYNYSKPVTIILDSKTVSYEKNLIIYVITPDDCIRFEEKDRCNVIDASICSFIEDQGLDCPGLNYFRGSCCESYKRCC